jgi:hypothetical protein
MPTPLRPSGVAIAAMVSSVENPDIRNLAIS